MDRRLCRGFTLVELLVSVAIAGVLLGVAVPSFQQTIARARLEGVANELAIDLQYTRSEAVRRRTTATIAIDAGGTFYTITYLNQATNASVTLKTNNAPSGVTLAGSAPIVFDSLRGMANAATLDLTSSQTVAQLRVLTSPNGRVRMCTPGGSFTGYTPC